MIGTTKKLNYVLNRLGVISSYDTLHRLRTKSHWTRKISPPEYNETASVSRSMRFSVDNLDESNTHGVLVHWTDCHIMHITAIQVIICNVKPAIPRLVRLEFGEEGKERDVADVMKFINEMTRGCGDPDIDASASLFVGIVYQHQVWIFTLDKKSLTSIFRLVSSMFSGFRNETEICYVDLIDESSAQKTEMHKSIAV